MVAQGITILVWVIVRRAYPLAVQRGWLCRCCRPATLTQFYRIKQADVDWPWQYTYRPPQLLPSELICCRGLKCTFTYEGEVDEEGRPDGWVRRETAMKPP